MDNNDRTDYFTPCTCARGNYCYSYYIIGKLPIEVNKDEIPHGLIPDTELPPPLPPKLIDAPPVPPKKMEMISKDHIHRAPPLPPKINYPNSVETNFITSPPKSVVHNFTTIYYSGSLWQGYNLSKFAIANIHQFKPRWYKNSLVCYYALHLLLCSVRSLKAKRTWE